MVDCLVLDGVLWIVNCLILDGGWWMVDGEMVLYWMVEGCVLDVAW